MGAALQTDLYQLSMAAGYFREGRAEVRASCELFVRRLPARRTFLLVAGLERALSFLEALRFEADELDYLASTPALADAFRLPGFRTYLEALRFTGDVWAMPEGTVAFEGEPLLRVEAPIVQAQLVETFLLSAVNHATAIATKAARVVEAAAGRAVVEFGARRAHPEAAIDAARAAYLAGCSGTSNLEAGRRFGIPVLGTAAHMWVMAHASEREAFESYLSTFPSGATLLVDTYDTLEGTKNALRAAGPSLRGVRLDSGDLLSLSREVRGILDAGGAKAARIVASGDLDEESVARLVEAGAPIDTFGVGTELIVSRDAPALGGVYKLVEVERDGRNAPVAKFADGKVTWPGRKQVYRNAASGLASHDALALADEPPPSGRPLLVPVMRGGRRVSPAEPLAAARERARASLAELPRPLARPWEQAGPAYEVRPSAALRGLLDEVRREVRDRG